MVDKMDYLPEKICDFDVSSSRKKLWACEIELLELLDDLCEKLNISYFAFCGAALGAVRHQGFIPWDDDIDIGMMREDFEVLRSNIKNVFPDYVTVQYGISDQRVDLLMRIRDGRTTAILFGENYKNGNKGVFIEIYPFDHVNNTTLLRFQRRLNSWIYQCMDARVNDKRIKGIKGVGIKIVNFLVPVNRLWKVFECVAKVQNGIEGRYIDTTSIPSPGTFDNRHMFFYDDCRETIIMKYEYSKIRMPIGYKRVLERQFDNYMLLPPKNERGVIHRREVFYDPNKPYTFYEGSNTVDDYFFGVDKGSLL